MCVMTAVGVVVVVAYFFYAIFSAECIHLKSIIGKKSTDGMESKNSRRKIELKARLSPNQSYHIARSQFNSISIGNSFAFFNS